MLTNSAPTIIQHINQLSQQLEVFYPAREARNIAVWVLEYLSGSSKLQIYTHPNNTLSPEQQQNLLVITQRLLQHEPVQYVLEQAPFFDMLLSVNPQVLIPRPETEELVQRAVQYLQQTEEQNPQITDVGTGSGCIAIAIKRLLPKSGVFAIDISEGALQVAELNARKYQTRVSFICADILNEESVAQLPGNLSLVISNPPYITLSEKQQMAKHVADFEPHLALFVPDDLPLLFYRAIARYAQRALNKGGALFFEVHEHYANEVKQLLQGMNFGQVTIYPDNSGRQRIVSALRVAENIQ
ncbi:peptide chain release factor N(5)-glutamine methyltransferase [Sphingobacteriales bacterium UPWRP_1]|nr:protein-(glutamine-N5) methyltransferase, release factor-specific [Sphingobacteriales bacterium TSM_CSM]PSJ74526.1 peptide chain release factor N(5)-glutamine methyltransferase [Sphingobacteriales bacterium UPWRP_1]